MTILTATEPVAPVASGGVLLLAALTSIALIVVLISYVKLHPFLALLLGGVAVGVFAGRNVMDVITSFGDGFGSTATGVGLLIALGAMFAKLLSDSGGADQIVDTIVSRSSVRTLPWAMALVGAVIGLPMFFEIGLVLLMPVIYLVARRAQVSLITIGIPTLAGLSAMHGLVPPHPGPLAAIGALEADLGTTLALGVIVAIPVIVVSGPLFGRLAGRWVVVDAPHTFDAAPNETDDVRRPSFGITLFSVLLPLVLMLAKAIVDITINDPENRVQQVFDVIGNPLVALTIAVLVAMFTLGRGAGMDRRRIASTVEQSLPPIAGIMLIVAAGGGFKQSLVDTGIGTELAGWAQGSGISAIVLAWVLAVLIRLATGSATVATITAASLVVDLVANMPAAEVSLVVLAVGAGSVFFSHVNDAGFWLVKEYFGLDVVQTIKSWSLMETVLSVSGLVFVLALSLVI
ncbi:GntP family gluconate:H+ symporter [Nocardioides luteus]|uniref:Gluconate permease n=1 Tax=Nocardioides luteus TaxID=1844 RepID=A0ABQ5T0H5_9ACTN|nr:gluconate:H+ symporter [Nocardioides luteus]MDR7310475.1 GntP family gluconate:H+ symporter [Nocardioides luteus]GGR73643.1 putative gluconate permease [Nocardioides luteus]GLJ69744.1 putative gluconate permease [Nocardioides luteus]